MTCKVKKLYFISTIVLTYCEKKNPAFYFKNCNDLSLFEKIVLVISKILQILGLQPQILKVFLDQ